MEEPFSSDGRRLFFFALCFVETAARGLCEN